MFHSTLLALHVLAVTIWVGGMFFSFFALRPAATQVLEAPKRLALWAATLRNFFPLVWLSVIVILISGMTMMSNYSKAPAYISIMMGTGSLMMLIFMYIYFAPYTKLKRAVKNQDWPEGGKHISKIRVLIAGNTLIGLATIFIATAGKVIF